MNDKKFKQLILDVYKQWKTLFRREHVELLGFPKIYNFSGYIYGKDLEGSFRDIENVEESIDIMKPDLLVLKSRTTNQEVGICKHDIDNYIIDENLLIVGCEDKKLLFQM